MKLILHLRSVGIILAEMCTKRPLLSGVAHTQLQMIVSKFGWPSEDFIAAVKANKRELIEPYRKYAKVVPVDELLPHAPDRIREIIKHLLILSTIIHATNIQAHKI